MTAFPGMSNPLFLAATEITITNLATNPVFAAIFYLQKELLKSAGWTVGGSGDGTSYNAGADLLVSAAVIHNNPLSWLRLIAPFEDTAGNRQEWLFQMVNATATACMRVKHSRGAGFTGGAPSATQVPSATDEYVLLGGGTDAAPTGAVAYQFPPTNTPDIYAAVWGAADQSSNAWYFCCLDTNWSQDGHASFVDPVQSAGDLDDFPYVFAFSGGTGITGVYDSSVFMNNTAVQRAYVNNGAGTAVLQVPGIKGFFAASTQTFPEQTDPNELVTEDVDFVPIVYANYRFAAGSPGYVKGYSSLFAQIAPFGVNTPPVTYLFGYNVARDLILCGDVIVAMWDGSTPNLPNIGAWTDVGTAYYWQMDSGAGPSATAVMRATDTTLAQTVYFEVIDPTAAAAEYAGPGPLTGIVTFKEL